MELNGKRLREARELSGLSLSAMAREIKMTAGHLSRIEKDQRPVPAWVVQAYERVLATRAEKGEGIPEMDRRKLLKMIPFVGAGAALDSKDLPFSSLSPRQWVNEVDALDHEYWHLGANQVHDRVGQLLTVAHSRLETGDPDVWEAYSRLQMLNAVSGQHREYAPGIYQLAIAGALNSGYADRAVAACGRAAIVLAQAGDPKIAVHAQKWALQALQSSHDHASVGQLNALLALSHLATMRGDIVGSRAFLNEARKTFNKLKRADGETDSDMPAWRMALTESRLLSGWGDPAAVKVQDAVASGAPRRLTRVFTQIEMHRGLLQAKQGDYKGGLAYATKALNQLEPAKQSVTLHLIVAEIKAIASPRATSR